MPKKYLVYIGSTLDDLKSEDRELFRLVLELGHIPIRSSCGEDGAAETALANKIIAECDYFISMVAHRYSKEGEQSPMELEYTQALNCGIPVIALIVDEDARWRANKKETNPAQIRKLKDFKSNLRKHPHASWSNTLEFCQKAQSLLLREINIHPRKGWIPGNEGIHPAVANELARLGAENGDLRRRLGIESGDLVMRLREQLKHAVKVLALNRALLSFYYENGKTWENTRKFRYLRIFKVLAPELYIGKTTMDISRFLGGVLNPDLKRGVRKDFPTPSNTIKKIMADFVLLKLICCTGGAGPDGEIWEITEYGKELYAVYRVRQLEKPFERLAAQAQVEAEALQSAETAEPSPASAGAPASAGVPEEVGGPDEVSPEEGEAEEAPVKSRRRRKKAE
ncbi:MAG: DUF4062 domain-containing protein [Treponema sp.]|jgi:hypothetical protein|nr:DUF4062 domain-containing protein [Treponema sp.]